MVCVCVYVCACSNTLCGSVGVALHLVWHWAAKIRADPIHVSLLQRLPAHPHTHTCARTHTHTYCTTQRAIVISFYNPDALYINVHSHT